MALGYQGIRKSGYQDTRKSGYQEPSVVNQKSLDFVCHSGLDPESSLFELDSCFRRNDSCRD
jgi:hypothetical protein